MTIPISFVLDHLNNSEQKVFYESFQIPIINFDEDGNLISDKSTKILDFIPYSNRVIMNDWCNSNFLFDSSNGISVESFFNDVPWELKRGDVNVKYLWGNDIIKKIKNKNYIFGAAPFVYLKSIYKPSKYKEIYQTVFLPKSDEESKTQLSEKRDVSQKLTQEILNLNLTNPIFICFPYDYEYYKRIFPSKIKKSMYCLGYNGYEKDWNEKLLKTIAHSKELYFNIISTPCVYSAYLRKRVKFYNSNVQYLPTKYENSSDSFYTIDKKKKPGIWHSFMDYITDVFENEKEDIDFWIYNFLSLDLIKSPQKVFDDLLTLHNNHSKIRLNFVKDVSLEYYYNELTKKVKTFNITKTKPCQYYYDRI
jgi:hypothetical protein